MAARRAGKDGLLEDALAALAAALRATGAPWMIIGGVAVIARGVRRFTTDIDAAVRGDAIDVTSLIAALASRKIIPRIPDAAAFARANLVLLMRHAPTGVDLDVSLAWSSFEHEALAASSPCAFGSVTVPMSSAEDLVLFKAIAGRPRDVEDAEALLVLYPKINLARTRRRLAALAELAESPEIVSAFEATVARARGTRRRSGQTARRPGGTER